MRNSNRSILVHICCSVNSHHFLTELRTLYPSARLIGYFYNPNIHPYEEYQLRLLDVARSCAMLGVALMDESYDIATWLCATEGHENAPEKGERCGICFAMRLHKSAQKAKEQGISQLTTTLLTSPLKPQAELLRLARQSPQTMGSLLSHSIVAAIAAHKSSRILPKKTGSIVRIIAAVFMHCKTNANVQAKILARCFVPFRNRAMPNTPFTNVSRLMPAESSLSARKFLPYL